MTAPARPAPIPTRWSQPFWDALEEGRFTIQVCNQCGAYQGYPRVFCTRCYSDDLGWRDSPGTGAVYTHTTVTANPPSTFVADLPYTLVIVSLDEGVHFLGQLVSGDEPVAVECGDRVKLRIVRRDGVPMPAFEAAGG